MRGNPVGMISLIALAVAACSVQSETITPTTTSGSTITVPFSPPDCPDGYEPGYHLGGLLPDDNLIPDTDPPELNSSILRHSFIGCVDASYAEQAPREAWEVCPPPETTDLTEESDGSDSTDAGNGFYDTPEPPLIPWEMCGLRSAFIEERWTLYEEGREAMACQLEVEELFASYDEAMTQCAQLTFPVFFWYVHGPGPEIILPEDLS